MFLIQMQFSVYKVRPYFYSYQGNYNIEIPNSFFSNDGKTALKSDCFYTTEDYEINGGEEKFRVKELEYFQINFL